MASWDDPSNSNPSHVNVLQALAEKDTYSATLGQVNPAGYTDLPDGTMNWDNGQKLLRRLQSGVPEIVKISLAGGGTGASDAAGARSAFNVLEAGTGSNQNRTNSQNDSRFVSQARNISTSSPLGGGGPLSTDLIISIQDATTTKKGAVQLDNTLTSTSTAKALTAAQGKALNDTIAFNNNARITDINNTNATVEANRLYDKRRFVTFRVDWDGFGYDIYDVKGDATYWGLSVSRIATGQIRILTARSGVAGHATAIDASPIIVTARKPLGYTDDSIDFHSHTLAGTDVDNDLFVTLYAY